MSGPMFELTDLAVERMLAQRAGGDPPAGLVGDIVAAVEATPQRRAGLLPWLVGPTRATRTPARLLVGLALLGALMVGALAAGWMLLRQDPGAAPPLLVYQVRGDVADVLLLDATTGTETLLGSVQVTAKIGGQRVDWAADGRTAIVFGDTDVVQARVDVAARAIVPLDLRDLHGGQDAVSPAGDRVARLVGDVERGFALSVVDLEGTELVRVALPAGAEALDQVAWAPDGTAVAVSACVGCTADALKATGAVWSLLLVPLDGTPIRTLEAPAGTTPSQARFSPDGRTIAFAGGDGIWTIGVADGAAARLTTNKGGSPAWSPDGGRIAFAAGGDGGTGGLFVVDSDGGNPVQLTARLSDGVGGLGPVWSPDGRSIAYTRDLSDTSLGDLWVVPSSGGDERLLRSNAVADWGPTPPADLAPHPAPPGEGATPSAEPAAETTTPNPSPPAPASPRSSNPPAGSTPLGGGLLLVWRLDGLSGTEAKTETVYTLDVGSGEETPIGTLPVNEDTCCPGPVQWSADRRQAFLSQLLLQAIVDVEAGTIKQVRKPPAGQFKEAISNRGDRIARVDEVSGTAPTIVVSRVNGRELQRIPLRALDFVWELAWSPDDTALAVVGATGDGDEPEAMVSHLVVAELDGSPPRELASNAADPVPTPPPIPAPMQGQEPANRPPGLAYWSLNRGYLGPSWSPDGRTIAVADRTCFSGRDLDFTGIRLQHECTGRLLGFDVASGEQTVLVEGNLVPGRAAWSHDGRRIAFGQAAADGSNPGIFVADRNGGNVTRLAHGDEDVQWSPDGTWLAFTRLDWDLPEGTDHAQLWVVPAAGGPAKLIAAPATGGW